MGLRTTWRRLIRQSVRGLGLARLVAVEEAAHCQNRFLYKEHVKWWEDRAWIEPYSDFLKQDASPRNGTNETRILDRRFGLAEFSRAVRKLSGSTAECGVHKGVGSGMICQTLQGTYGVDDWHFAFDSYEGLPTPTAKDLNSSGKSPWKPGQLAVPEAQVGRLLARFEFCRIVKGWIPESLDIAAKHRFRLVHIDVDLYDPTLASLEFFYPRLVPRGLVVFDDYGLTSCPGARAAVSDFFADKPEPVMELSAGQAVIVRV